MITRRARLVTGSSIKALSEVCYSNTSANSIKVAFLGQRLSTATEAFPYYQNNVESERRNGSNPEYYNQYKVGSDRSLNSDQFDQSSRNEFNQSTVGFGGRVYRSSRVSQEVNWDKSNVHVSGGGNDDRYEQNGVGYSGGGGRNFDGNVRQNWGNSNGSGVGNYQQNWDGYNWSSANEQPQNYREHPENLNGPNGVSNQSRDWNYRGGNGGHMHDCSVGQWKSSESKGSVSNFGQYQQPDNVNYAPNKFDPYQRADNNSYAPRDVGQYQRAINNSYSPSVGGYHHADAQNNNGNVGNQYQYQGSNVQQNPYGNLIYRRNAVTGPSQSDLTTPSTSSQVPGYSNTDGSSTDGLEVLQIRGTIEELDQYAKDGKLKEALEVLEIMEKNQQRLFPVRDILTVFKLIEACGEAKADKEAKILHKALVKLLTPLTVRTYDKLLEMYLKCGSIEEAYSLFDDIPCNDLTSWDIMIRGLVKNDLGEEAVDIFTELKNTDLKPDGQIFLGVFSACGIVGDVTEGMLHFQSMSKEYGITPSMQHYVGVVEMLGYAEYLDNAIEFVENMPVKPSIDVWETLMRVSRIQGNVEIGDRCAELVEKLDPSRLSEQSKAGLIPLKASDLEKEKEKKKLASKNLLEVRSRVHEYRAGDTSHPENDRIYALLRGLKTQMKEAGYIPELRGVLHDIDPEGKEEALLAHSERLAAAYGFLTTAARQPIRVIKNLRVCVDCHNALKIISKLVGRELIMRDAKRFHHFKDGVCSCKDYW